MPGSTALLSGIKGELLSITDVLPTITDVLPSIKLHLPTIKGLLPGTRPPLLSINGALRSGKSNLLGIEAEPIII